MRINNYAVQLYGRVVDSLPKDLTWGYIYYQNELAFREEFAGKPLNTQTQPDICIEVHTRPFYAHMMPSGIPRAVYFCNFPGGYYHNEALVDLYDFIFYTDPMGQNYIRFHGQCQFLQPWMPDAFQMGSGLAYALNTDYYLGSTRRIESGVEHLTISEFVGCLSDIEVLQGRWFLGEADASRVAAYLGVCFKADEVYVCWDSPLRNLFLTVGAGLFKNHLQGFEILQKPRSKRYRREMIRSHHLFRSRIAHILSVCLAGKSD